MNRGEHIVSLLKLGTTTAIASPIFQIFTEVVAFPVFGAPITLILAALVGAGLSLFFGDPIIGRRNLWGQIAGAVAFGTGAGVLVSDAMDWAWATRNLPLFVMCCSAVIRWFLPTVIERGKQLIREFKFPWAKKSNPEGEEK